MTPHSRQANSSRCYNFVSHQSLDRKLVVAQPGLLSVRGGFWLCSGGGGIQPSPINAAHASLNNAAGCARAQTAMSSRASARGEGLRAKAVALEAVGRGLCVANRAPEHREGAVEEPHGHVRQGLL